MVTVHVRGRADVPIDEPSPSVDPNDDPELWERESGRRLRALLGSTADRVRSAMATNRSVVRISGLPRDPSPPPSPYHDESRWREIPITLANVFGAVDLLNARSFAYSQENRGRVVRNVVARIDARDEYSSQGWGRDLGPHMDDAFRAVGEPERPLDQAPAPRWLVFGVIYDRPRVPLSIAAVDEVVKRLATRDVEALCRPEFDVKSPASFGGPQVAHGLPILISDGRGGWFSRFDCLNCAGTTAAASNALDALSELLATPDVWEDVDLHCGDVIILDNFRALHMRSEYTPRWDGSDRWLIRLYAVPKSFRGVPDHAGVPHAWK